MAQETTQANDGIRPLPRAIPTPPDFPVAWERPGGAQVPSGRAI